MRAPACSPDDESIAQKLRRGGRNTLVAVNKVEGEEPEGEFEPLGFEQLPISAEHGLGVGALLDAACHRLPQVDEPEAIDALRIAIIGRPNVGKSSLLNRLLGAERAVVSKVPGTTRDAVDAPLTKGDRRYLFVDTAGIRKIRLLTENVDHVSVVQARRALARAEIAILVVDLEAGVREMDATIAGYAHAAGRGVVIAINKWDRAMALGIERKTFEQDLRDNLKFLSFAPIVTTSALSGRGLERLLQTADRISVAQRERVQHGTPQSSHRPGGEGPDPAPREGQPPCEHSVRHSGGCCAPDIPHRHESAWRSALLVPQVPGKPTPKGVWVRGDATRLEGSGQETPLLKAG